MTLTEYEHLEQGSDQWLAARLGIVTASVVGQLITRKPPSALDYTCPQCDAEPGGVCVSLAKKEPAPIKVPHSPRSTKAAENPDKLPERLAVADNDTSQNLTATLVAERITGWSDPMWVSADMQRGHDVEPIARDWYADFFNRPVKETGFMVRTLTSGARIGWSPDGLVAGTSGIEVKAPRAKKHLLTILNNEVPPEHMAQCQAGLFVSGREHIDFCSYYGGMKPFVKRVFADQRWFDVIEATVEQFETKAAQMQVAYATATTGLPDTERLLTDMEIF